MRPDDVREFLTKTPFQPFRITLTDGRTYDVRHPEMVMVGRTTMVVGIPAPDLPEPVYDRAATLSLIHVMHLEAIDGAVRKA